MFITTKIADLVQIPPHDFSKRSRDAIEDLINAKYANRVIQGIGLCVCLYDLLWTSEGLVGHGTGLVNVNVEFHVIVFRPFKGEVLLARIRSSNPTGVHLRTDFFDDIFVPIEHLPEGVEFDHKDQLWVWNYEDERLVLDNNEMVRFQVVGEEWNDQTPEGPQQDEANSQRIVPYKLLGSMAKLGLGLCYWWDEV